LLIHFREFQGAFALNQMFKPAQSIPGFDLKQFTTIAAQP
jgi:hypothetical protein